VFADGGCNISLFSSTFISGQCTSQASGSTTVYFIVSTTRTPHADERRDTQGLSMSNLADGMAHPTDSK